MDNGWIGVDLDGTLAEYHAWNKGVIGPPVPLMVQRVKRWLAQGWEVRIMTARVCLCSERSQESGATGDERFVAAQRDAIERWCQEHLGVVLPVTATKDFRMAVLYDDRCVQVKPNSGELMLEANECPV